MRADAAFPESRFTAGQSRRNEYQTLVRSGRSIMREKSAVICGVARDVGDVLPRTIARIEQLGEMFADYRVVLYENDSGDGTGEALAAWEKENPRVTILSEQRGDPVNLPIRSLERAARMAYYRNRYRGFIESTCPDFDHVIVVDTDLKAGWSYDGVANTFGHSDWDFVGSYGIIQRAFWKQTLLLHYDAWAFREEGSYAGIPTKAVNHMRWRRGDPMFRVYSCFGGLGVYQMQAMLRCKYDGSDCERVTFHRNMLDVGLDRLYLNPSQITFYGRKANNLVRACHRLTDTLFRRAA